MAALNRLGITELYNSTGLSGDEGPVVNIIFSPWPSWAPGQDVGECP